MARGMNNIVAGLAASEVGYTRETCVAAAPQSVLRRSRLMRPSLGLPVRGKYLTCRQ